MTTISVAVTLPIHLGLWLPITDRRLSAPAGQGRLSGISHRGAVLLLTVILAFHVTWTALVGRSLAPTPTAIAWLGFSNVLLAPFFFTVAYNLWIHLKLRYLPQERPWECTPSGPGEALPTVSVVIPCRNEPFEVVLLTVGSALNLEYPAERLRVVVTDNSEKNNADFHKLREFVDGQQSHGTRVELIHRDGTEGFKAGNLDHALQIVDTDLVLFLDVDNSIPKDFLIKNVAAFRKEQKLAYLQCYNLPCNQGMGRFASAASVLLEQHKFMEFVNATIGGWSFFQGHACLWRTAALRGITPLSQSWRGESILTEDLCMTVRVIQLGMHGRTEWIPSAYWAPTRLIDLERMLVRWCYGSWQIYLRSFRTIVFDRVKHLDLGGHVGLWRHITADKIASLFPFFVLLLPHHPVGTLLLLGLWFSSTYLLPLIVVALRRDANFIRPQQKKAKLVDIHLLSLFSGWCQIRACIDVFKPRPHVWIPTPKDGQGQLHSGRQVFTFRWPLAFCAAVTALAPLYVSLYSDAFGGLLAVLPMLYQAAGMLLAIVAFRSCRAVSKVQDVESYSTATWRVEGTASARTH